MRIQAKQLTELNSNRLEYTVTELETASMDGNGIARLAIDQCINHVMQFLDIAPHRLSGTL